MTSFTTLSTVLSWPRSSFWWRLQAHLTALNPTVKCTQLGIPFCPQVGHTGPLMPSEPGRCATDSLLLLLRAPPALTS